jgi:tRNA A37 threonylcarbamoyltransferase TsaD
LQDLSAVGAALRHSLQRLLAARRARPVRLVLPPVESASDIAAMLAAIATAVGRGRITPGEAAALSEVADTYMRALATSEFDRRLRALEAAAHVARS